MQHDPGYQLKLYDTKKHSDNDVALAFNLGTVVSNRYGKATLSGHFLCFVPFAAFPKANDQKIKTEAEELKKWCDQIVLFAGMGVNYSEEFSKAAVQQCTFLFAPDVEPKAARLLSHFIAVTNAFDRFLLFIKQQRSCLSNVEVNEIFSAFMAVLLGSDADLKNSFNIKFPYFHPVFTAFRVFHHEILSINTNTSCLLDELAYYISVSFLEIEHFIEMDFYTKDDYMFERPFSGGIYLTIEIINIIKNNILPKKITRHLLYRKILYQASMQILLANDLLALKKEITDDEFDNLVLLNQRKYSLQTSIIKVNKKVNQLSYSIKKLCKKFQDCFTDNLQVSQFIKGLYYFLDGHLYWYEQCERYGNIQFNRYGIEYDREESFKSDN